MKIVSVTDCLVRNIIHSLTIEEQTRDVVNEIVGLFGRSYSEFIYSAIGRHSSNYIPINSKHSPLNNKERSHLNGVMSKLPFRLNLDDILVADRMDLIYATDPTSYSEFSKFSPLFYSVIEEHFHGEEGFLDSSLFMESITELERVVSVVEQMIMAATTEELIEDTVILMLVEPNPSLFVIVY